MSLTSVLYPAFLLAAVTLYYVLPRKLRVAWVLAVSLTFYAVMSGWMTLLLPPMILAGWLGGLWLNGGGKRKARLVLCVIAVLLPLLVFKYAQFFADTGVGILALFGKAAERPELNLIAPLGISFFTFQTVGYLVDTYRNGKAERNLIRYAAFVAFFPTVTAGPIERKDTLLAQLREEHPFRPENVKKGLLTMLYGYFLKLVLSDRMGLLVNQVFTDWAKLGSVELILGAVFFAFQLYCDFAGCSLLALGAAETMGFSLIRNFEAPYFSVSVAEFWRRWHISLSTWFRDYLYIPMGGNRKGKGRKYLNLMTVFLVSGLWHGAGWTFVIWGGLNGAYQVIGDLLKPARKKLAAACRCDPETAGNRFFRGLFTFLLIDLSWIFFRAPDLETAFGYIGRIVTEWDPWVLSSGKIYELGLNQANMLLTFFSLTLLLIADWCRYRKTDLRDRLLAQGIAFRWVIILLGIFFVLIYGMWGTGYDATSFIYAGF